MKKLIGVMLVAVAGAAVFAAPAFRVDVNGARKEGKVRLEPVAGEQMKVMAPSFRPEAERVNYVTAYSAAPLKAGEWTECTFSFRAADGGRVTLEMGGQWAQNKDAREWVLVGPVKVNGEVLPNSDYAKTYKAGNGRTMPSGYWLAGVSEIVPGAGPDGKAAIRTNHDNRFYRVLVVEPGKTYTVSAMVKPAE